MIAARALAVLGAVALLAGCSSGPDDAPDVRTQARTTLTACPAQPDEPVQGSAVLPALDLDCPGGGALDLARAPGVPTLVNLWGSWCPPCREEMPVLQQLSQAAGDQLRVVGVISKDGQPQAESFAADAGVTFPSAFDGEGKLMAGLGIKALPYTYFLDADGALVYTQVGPVSSLDELRGLVAEHLGVRL
jgi:cytochrome c biogenesis protein CcmG, thiol:disulfide interchange protein DsbE